MPVVHRRPGRPRDDSREAAILAATLELLGEVGYDRLTVDAVAARARASKATLYRRWPGKAEVVVEALRCRVPEGGHGCADTGSLVGDLTALVQASVEMLGTEEGQLVLALLGTAVRDPQLAALMRSQVMTDKGPLAQELVDRAVDRGELPRGSTAAPLVEVLPALILYRHLISGQPLDETFTQHVVRDVLVPLLTTRSPA